MFFSVPGVHLSKHIFSNSTLRDENKGAIYNHYLVQEIVFLAIWEMKLPNFSGTLQVNRWLCFA